MLNTMLVLKTALSRLAPPPFLRRMSSAAPLLLSPSQANDLITSNAPVTFLDSTWFMPNSPRNAKQEFLTERIPGSQFLDLDEVANPHPLGLKHMLPEREIFARSCEKFGITPSTHVVLYDAHGVFSAPRGLFMFRTLGHNNSSIIDGGLPRWAEEGLPIETGAPTSAPSPSTYTCETPERETPIRSYEDMVSNSKKVPSTDIHADLVLDARPKGRFTGADPEPRPGLSSGHIPHSHSLTFNLFLKKHTTRDGKEFTTFLAPADIRQAVEAAVGTEETEKIIRGERRVTATCGSGMTAGVLWLGLQMLGVKQVGLYDESWTGYAMRSTSEIHNSR